MFPRLLLALLVLSTAALSAQRGGGSLMGAQEGPPPAIGQPLSIFEQFVGQLKLDAKTQLPAVEEIVVANAKLATPLGTEMLQIRQRLVNAELQNKPEDAKALLETYTVAATKMAAIEAQTFASVYALLKPNQQSRAAEAFTLMAGIYLPTPPPTRAARGAAPRGGR